MKKIGSSIAGYIRSTDKWLLLLWLSASGLSAVFLSGLIQSELLPGDTTIVRTQLIASGVGLFAALVMSLIDYHFILKMWKLITPVCLMLVALTFTGLATTRGDNTAWVDLGFTTIQPSELLKISFIITFSLHISKVREHLNHIPHLLLLCLHGGAHVLLIQLQGDTGSAIVFACIFMTMLFCAGVNWRYIFLAVAVVGLAVLLLWEKLVSADQLNRILVVYDPKNEGITQAIRDQYLWQQDQALKAFVSGGMQGTGIFSGKHVYVAEAYNDFLFSFIGESAGLVGCLGVMALLLVIALKVLFDSWLAKDDSGKLLCIGVFAMTISQMVINIGMNIGIMPVIGVTLPLFSSGGSSMLSMYLGLGLVLSVYCHSKSELFFD